MPFLAPGLRSLHRDLLWRQLRSLSSNSYEYTQRAPQHLRLTYELSSTSSAQPFIYLCRHPNCRQERGLDASPHRQRRLVALVGCCRVVAALLPPQPCEDPQGRCNRARTRKAAANLHSLIWKPKSCQKITFCFDIGLVV